MKKIIPLLLFISLFAALTNAALASPLPDTGQTQSYTDTFGEDSDYTINPPSYTDNGDGTVTDNVTGLMWQQEDDDTTRAWDEACSYCQDLVLGGYSDWRLPSVFELMSIVDYGTYNPSIDTTYFSGINVPDYNWWSSTTRANSPSVAWRVHFLNGGVGTSTDNKSYPYYVRCVRGGVDAMAGNFTDNGDGTVTDSNRGLMWQQEEGGSMTSEDAITYSEDLSLAGFTDWRLPNIKELRSIVDDSLTNPAIDKYYFPNAHDSSYWSSTSDVRDIFFSLVWRVPFGHGAVLADNMYNNHYVRAVRGGQNQILGNLVISSPSQASAWAIGSLMSITWGTQGIAGNVKISMSRQGGKDGTFETIVESTENDGSYDWNVTGTESVNCMLNIEPIDAPSKRTTQGLFTVYILKATISGTPVSPTNQTGATLMVGGDYVTHYKYKIDEEETYSDEIPVATQISLSNLTDGIHTVYVIARNEVGNWQSEDDATSVSWTVDTTEPVITGLSIDTTPTQSKTWAWDATDATATTFRYAIDQNETWTPTGDFTDTKTATKSGVDGTWYIHVQAKDAAGNESDIVTVSAILDNTAPTATISGAPSSPTNQTGATLTIGGEGVTHYKYKLDDGDYSSEISVSSAITLSDLDDGSHTVYVLGRDSAGNWQADATTVIWTVDTVPPTPSVSGAPASLTSATITVGGEGVTHYKYKLDDEETWSDEIPVTTQISLTDLADGIHTIYIIACDAAGNWQSEDDATSFTWTVDTTPPTADAGPDQTVDEGVTVTLNGLNSSDTDSGIASYSWEQTAGTSVTLSDSTAAQPTFTSPQVGPDGESLTFQLTVTNNAGLQDTDTCIVNITWENDPPTANAGPDQTAEEGVEVTLDGSNSTDLDDGIATYLWEQLGGPAVSLSSTTAAQPTFTAPDVGPNGESLTFQLTVTDNGGLQSTDSCIVNVTGDNDPPTADAGRDQTVDEGVTVTLDGSNSTDDEAIHRYLWSQSVGTPVTLSDTTAIQPTFVTPPIDSNGTHLEFILSVIDITGLQHTDKVSIDVEDNGITGFPADVLPTESSTGKNIGIKVESGGSITGFMVVIPSSLPDTTNMPEDFIYGLISMQLKPDTAGGTVKVTVYLANPAPEGYTWYKYGTNDGWYDFSNYAEFNDDRDQVTLTLTDGEIGDDDGIANGVIVDPSGLGASPGTSTPSGGGCFIVTVANGSPMAEELATLKTLHDNVLLRLSLLAWCW